ncbi:MAG: RagB/SusD family nutrient uptake outer membrane protein, partial [Muribaculaceae bacterium]|nr:RagB/SusD family nutrient uptake outer membrane protein [Muribaculaceae bacterium]
YDAIPATDCRKNWFLDADLKSATLTAQQQSFLDSFSDIPPYTQVKFGPYKGVVGTSTNANDIPLMRVEEMYYILAESQAMSGNVATAKTTLENFVKTYRDPKFAVADGITAEDFQEVVYQQRRVEFFGEGLSWFDIMRLNKVLDRTNSNFPPAYSFYIEPNDGCRIYCIPTGEINGNPQISDSDNNPNATRPTPVA